MTFYDPFRRIKWISNSISKIVIFYVWFVWVCETYEFFLRSNEIHSYCHTFRMKSNLSSFHRVGLRCRTIDSENVHQSIKNDCEKACMKLKANGSENESQYFWHGKWVLCMGRVRKSSCMRNEFHYVELREYSLQTLFLWMWTNRALIFTFKAYLLSSNHQRWNKMSLASVLPRVRRNKLKITEFSVKSIDSVTIGWNLNIQKFVWKIVNLNHLQSVE